MTTEVAIVKLKEAVQLLEFEDGETVKQLQEIITKLENKYYGQLSEIMSKSKRELKLTLTEDDLDIICNALDAYVIEYLLDEDMKKYITQASSTRDKINKLIPDSWNWAGE